METPLGIIFNEIRDSWKKDRYSPEINERHDEIAPVLEKLIIRVSENLGTLKKESGVMAFDDLEFLSKELVLKNPEILESWRKEWDFWFIDEFQDTSPLQKDLLFSFFQKPWNAYFVGDPQQSVYLFRGADENVFQETKKIVASNEGRVEKLEVNYRSDPDLLKFLNLIFSKLKKPLEALRPRGLEGGSIRAEIHLAEKSVDEVDLVINQIIEWQGAGVLFQEMAVLVSKNAEARLIGRRLSVAGIPVYVHSSGGFYDRREILDALALLSFIEDPSDDDTFVILSRSPWIGISDLDLAQWGPARKKMTFWEWIKVQPELKSKYPSLNILEKAIADADVLPLSLVYSHALESLGFWEFCLVGDSSGRREANLRKLLWRLKQAESKPSFSAADFIDQAWQEVLDVGEETEAASFIEPERVNIMTIHKSKGLKFNCVIVPHCGTAFRTQENALELSPDGRWATRVLSMDAEEKVGPLVHGRLKAQRVEREKAEWTRVFYVALTRASDRLSLVGQAGWSPTSWLGQTTIQLTCGAHENCYSVRVWNEPPVYDKIRLDQSEELHRTIDLRPQDGVPTNSQLTVTHLVQNRTQGESFSLEKSIKSQQRGQAVHYIFEELKNSSSSSLDELCIRAQRRFGVEESIDSRVLNETLLISEPPLKELISVGKTEWPFVVRENGVTLKGQIDLWGTYNEVTWIVDYKSSKKLNEESLLGAKEQLELYALAISKLGIDWGCIRIAVIAPLQAKAKVLKLSPLEEIRSRIRPQSISISTELEAEI